MSFIKIFHTPKGEEIFVALDMFTENVPQIVLMTNDKIAYLRFKTEVKTLITYENMDEKRAERFLGQSSFIKNDIRTFIGFCLN